RARADYDRLSRSVEGTRLFLRMPLYRLRRKEALVATVSRVRPVSPLPPLRLAVYDRATGHLVRIEEFDDPRAAFMAQLSSAWDFEPLRDSAGAKYRVEARCGRRSRVLASGVTASTAKLLRRTYNAEAQRLGKRSRAYVVAVAGGRN